MTGIGAYMYIVWGIWLRHCLNNRQDEYYLWWPHFYNFPTIERVPLAAVNGYRVNGDGASKKKAT